MNGSAEASPRRGGPGRDFPILARDLIFAFFSQGGPRVRIRFPPPESQAKSVDRAALSPHRYLQLHTMSVHPRNPWPHRTFRRFAWRVRKLCWERIAAE